MAKINEIDLSGPKKLIKLMGGNSMYLHPCSRRYCNRIMKFLEERYNAALEKGAKRPRFTHNRLSKELGIGRETIRFNVSILTGLGWVRTEGGRLINDSQVRTCNYVIYVPPEKRKKIR